MEKNHTFAKFWRCALQVNPSSYSAKYRGNSQTLSEDEYNNALLKKCLDLDISIIGLADHGSVTSFEKLRDLFKQYKIIIFPGFEIASNDKTHFVCLFPEDTSGQQLERYLGNLELLDPDDGVRPSQLSSEQLINKIDQLGGFIYAAHCTSECGLLKNRLNHVWKNCKLRAAQIPGSIEDTSGIEGDFYRRTLLNKDDAYKRERPIAVINAKDIADPQDMDNMGATCYVKMTRPSFAAFKLAFYDPSSRIRLDSFKAQSPIGKIIKVVIQGGYLDGAEIFFSDHLNTIIGGRGTGKSTLLECIRYVFEIIPNGKQAKRIHTDIIKENLGKSLGKVEVTIISSSQNGKEYTISRRYGEPSIVRDATGNVSTLHPKDLLPNIEIFGQNEIYELAQDEDSRVHLIERFIPKNNYEEQINLTYKALNDNRLKLSKALIELDELKAYIMQQAKLEEELKSYIELGIKEKLSNVALVAREKELVNNLNKILNTFQIKIDELSCKLPDIPPDIITSISDLPNASSIIKLINLIHQITNIFLNYKANLQNEYNNIVAQYNVYHDDIQKALRIYEDEIEKALRSLPKMAGKNGQEIGVAYQNLLSEIERIKQITPQLKTYETLCQELQQERNNLLANLSDLRSDRIQILHKAVKKLNKRLEGKLKINILPEANRTILKNFLLNCNLEGIGEKRLSFIDCIESISPLSLAKSISQGATEIINQYGVTPLIADALIKLQPSQIMELEALELDHKIEILLNVNSSEDPLYRPLDKLSTGQQCTAILHLLLLENMDPLLMDQLEDNLDNAFIADRIVTELRSAKTERQFLFATHNANIPVFGDAEWIGIIYSHDNKGHIPLNNQGSIDVPKIRDNVANILEGGKAAFIQRKEKYEF